MARPKKVKETDTPKPVEPKEETNVLAVREDYGFSFLDQAEEITTRAQETIMTMAARRTNKPTQFKALGTVTKNMIKLHDLALQFLCDNPGMPEGGLIEIVGAEGTGKSTLAHHIEAAALLNGSPVYHQECENKLLHVNHIARIMSSDPDMARRMVKAVHYDTARSLEESYDKLIDWIMVMRGKETGGRKASIAIPMHVPLIAVIDPWGKLMSKDEAAGFYDFGKNMSDKEKSLLDASNMGHSKASHRWARRLPYILGSLNVTLILVQHQNTKVDMSGKGSPMAGDAGVLYNNTKVGGKGFDQLDSMQIILARKGLVKNSAGDKVGKTIQARMHKNSWGAESRVIEYDLINDQYKDIPPTETTAGKLDRVIRFERWTAEWLAENKALDITIKMRRVTCPSLGLTGSTYPEFYETLKANQPVMNELRKKLKIQGFYNALEDMESMLSAAENTKPVEKEEIETEEEGEVSYES